MNILVHNYEGEPKILHDEIGKSLSFEVDAVSPDCPACRERCVGLRSMDLVLSPEGESSTLAGWWECKHCGNTENLIVIGEFLAQLK